MSHATILIIDDDADYVAATQHLLERAGYAVVTAANGTDGYAVALRSKPDLILLDVMMTERTEGLFTLQRFKSNPSLHATPVIVVSSMYAEIPWFRIDPRTGWMPADGFLAKPVPPDILLKNVERALEPKPGNRAIGSVER